MTKMTSLTLGAFCLTILFSMAQAQELKGPEKSVIAIVGGQQILQEDFEAAFSSLAPEIRQQGREVLYPHILELLVQQTAILHQGRIAGVQNQPSFMARLRAVENRLIHDTYVQDEVARRLSDEMIMREYQRILQTQPRKEEIKARHILLKTKEEAEATIQLLSEGQDFAKLAQEYSQGPSAPNGGDLGYFQRGQMVEEFEVAVFGMPVNTYTSRPVQTQFGWHVILVEDKREVAPPTFAQLRPQIMQQLGEAIAHGVGQEAIAKSNVQRYDLTGSPIGPPKTQLPDLRSLSTR